MFMFTIDTIQFKALFHLFLRLDLNRGRSGKGKNQFVRMLIVYGILGGTLSGSLLNQTSPLAYTFIAFSYLMLMAASAVLIELGQELMMPEEFESLGYFPIQSRTYFSAKIANLLFYTGLISLALSIIPAGLGLLIPGADWRFPILFILGALTAGVFSAALMGLVMASLIRVMQAERLKNFISIFQVSLTVGLVFLFQLIPRASDAGTFLFNPSFTSWMICVPSAWFAGLVLKLSGQAATLPFIQLIIVLLIAGFILISGLYRLGRYYLTGITSAMDSSESSNTKLKDKSEKPIRTGSGWLRNHPEMQAGYTLTIHMLKRDRVVKLSVFPILGIALAFLIRAILEPNFINPFIEQSMVHTDASFNLFFFFLFVTIPLILNLLTYSRDWEAAWLYQTAPVHRPFRLIQGMQLAVLQMVMIPFFLLIGVIFSFKIPVSHAALHALFLSVSGLTCFSLIGVGMCHLPFSRERQQFSRLKRILMVLLAIPVMMCVRLLQHVAYADPAHYWTILVVLIGILIILERLVFNRFKRETFLARLAV